MGVLLQDASIRAVNIYSVNPVSGETVFIAGGIYRCLKMNKLDLTLTVEFFALYKLEIEGSQGFAG
ncbi:MAG: hypothetical protein OXD44_03240 [Gammaproteobacteria bacterium]|nr:hypothetical protein [Gammaproteobacteria bacterium]